jgi:methyl coenzyme M reductase subunit C
MEEQQFPASIKTVYAQACEAIAVSQGKRHILAPTCVIPAEASDGSLEAVLKAVSQHGLPG